MIRKYKKHSDILFNEGIFSIFNKNKDKNDSNKRKAIKESDQEMIELIEDIKKSFDINNLKSETSSVKYFYYKLNDIDIEINKYIDFFGLKINKDKIVTDLISDELLQELWDFFTEEEKKRNIKANSEYFGKALSSRRNADKYNL